MRQNLRNKLIRRTYTMVMLTILLHGCSSNESSTNAVNESIAANSENIDKPSIEWIGEFPAPEYITDPQYMQIYYNTSDGCSYIYTQIGWTLLAHSGTNNAEATVPNITKTDETNDIKGRDGQNGVDGKDGRDGIDGKDGVDGIDGRDGVDGKDGVDGIDGRDGIDGKDGVDGIDGRDGIDGKDGRDGVDGKDGFIFIRSTEESENGILYEVKSYAQLEAGNPYFYTYYKFYFSNNVLTKSYICYHTVANGVSPDVAYWDFSGSTSLSEPEYTKTYFDGYVISATSSVSNSYSIISYWPKSDKQETLTMYTIEGDNKYKTQYSEYYKSGIHKNWTNYNKNGTISNYYEYFENGEQKKAKNYNKDGSISRYYEYFENGQTKYYITYDNDESISSAWAYNDDGSIKSYDKNYVLALMGDIDINSSSGTTGNSSSSSEEVEQEIFKVESITLNRYHILNDDVNRDIFATIKVNNITLIDSSDYDDIYIQIVNVNQDSTVTNFKANVDANNLIFANITAPKINKVDLKGVNYLARLKIGEVVYSDKETKFNISSSYSVNKKTDTLRINLDRTLLDSFMIKINGYNFDFAQNIFVKILDDKLTQQENPTQIDLQPIQWINDSCKNEQTISAKLPIPQTEGLYTIEIYINNEKQEANRKVLVHKNPYFTSFTIPSYSSSDIVDYLNATLIGKNFKNANLDISLFDLTFSKDYEIKENMRYEATLINDTLITLKIQVPEEAGDYNISANYKDASITSILTVSKSNE